MHLRIDIDFRPAWEHVTSPDHRTRSSPELRPGLKQCTPCACVRQLCSWGPSLPRSSLSQEELIPVVTWADANAPYYGSYFGRRNLIYKDHPDFRPIPTLER